ncbi:uncharacterized protein LOC125242101 [Leguminivora glycinivorella]|uniref:uncharacterized protein LOC125242101 n=1 Tax=Leguminivora glycinivorella TaxID=1035111 RepID=UPI00200C4FFC|nr:uncharacterized protein LOC125242101 [Leguminivora glycinivorella]
MDPNYLLKDELEYELECRGVSIQSTVPVLRKILKELMQVEQTEGASRGGGAPAREVLDASSELDKCVTKLSVLGSYISEIVGKPDRTLFRRLVSRLYHVQGRLMSIVKVTEAEGNRKETLQQRCQVLLEKLEVQDDVLEEDDLTAQDMEILQQSLGEVGVRIIEKLKRGKELAGGSTDTPGQNAVGGERETGIQHVKGTGDRSVNILTEKGESLRDRGISRLLRTSTVDEEAPRRKLVPIYQWGLKFSGSNMSINAFLERVSELRVARNATDDDLMAVCDRFF